MPCRQECKHFNRPQVARLFAPRPSGQKACTCLGIGAKNSELFACEHFGQRRSIGCSVIHAVNRTPKCPWKCCCLALNIHWAERAVVPAFSGNHDPCLRHDLAESHGLELIFRQPCSTYNLYPLPF